MRKILLDTSAYSHFLRGNELVLDALVEADTIFMSIFVLGELYSGFRRGSKHKQNKKNLGKFLDKPSVQVLEGTSETALIFAEIKNALKSSGSPIPLNDIWIAANAIETGAVLITFDKHYTFVPGLRIWDEIG